MGTGENDVLGSEQILLLDRLVEQGLHLILHDPEGTHLSSLSSLSTATAAMEPHAGESRPLLVASAASGTLLHYGPGGQLEEIAAGYYASSTGSIHLHRLSETAVPLLTAPGETTVSALCQPQGKGSVVYSLVPLSPFLRGRQDSPVGESLRQQYAPNLVAYAAWGACNPAVAALPIAIDIVPGDPDNRIRRRGIAVVLLSSPLVDAVADIDPTTLRFGRTGVEDSLHRCFPRAHDVNGDGAPDLTCIFLYERTFLAKTADHGVLQARTRAGMPVLGSDVLRLPSLADRAHG